MKRQSAWTSAAARRLLSVAGNPPTVEDAVRIVAGWVLSDIPCPPTDLDAISPRLSISGFSAEDLPCSGELRREGKGFKIVYSSALSPERRRFTIAHEMGHAIFEAEAMGLRGPRSGLELERLCDLLATEMLMPRDIFLGLLGAKPSLQKVFALARTFKTSLSATAIRCAELSHVSVFEATEGSIRWSRGVVRKMEKEIRPTIDEALAGKPVDEIIYLHNKVWAGEWRLEGAPIGQGSRALFLLQPIRPLPHTSA